MNIPPLSVTWKDCANGSYQTSREVVVSLLLMASVFITVEPVNSLTCLSSFVGNVWIIAFLVEMIFSWTVSNVPAAVYWSSPNVSVFSWSFDVLSITVNVFVPVSKLGWLPLFGFGI